MAKIKLTTHDWSVLKPKLGTTQIDLLTGNGFSMRYSSLFSYKSLFEKFLKKCTPTEVAAYNLFETTNFEQIQRTLEIAANLNRKFRLEIGNHTKLKTKLRDGLINTVRENHPSYSTEIHEQLIADSSIVKTFDKFFTTNYDLLSYYLILLINDTLEKKYWWKDNFSGGTSNRFNPLYQDQTKLFYLHGALVLLKSETKRARKITNAYNKDLLESITDKIKKGDMPLFVSGGNTFEKQSQINEDYYLGYCLQRLRDSSNTLLTFGFGFDADTDDHIIRAIFNSKRNDVIVAVRDTVGKATAWRSASDVQSIWDGISSKKPRLHFVSPETVFPLVS